MPTQHRTADAQTAVRSQRLVPYLVFPAAQALSSLGDSALWLAAGLWIRGVTGSNSAAALTFMLYLLASLLAPWLGAFVDRHDRKRVIVWANTVGAIAVLPLGQVPSSDLGVYAVYAVVFVNGLMANLLNPAYASYVVEVADGKQLASINSTIRVTQTVLRIFAPVIGVWIYSRHGLSGVAIADASTFVVAASLMGLTKRRGVREDKPRDRIGYWTSVKAAVSVGPLRSLIFPTILFTICLGVLEPLMWAVVTTGLKQSPNYIAVLQVSTAVGSIAGGLVASHIVRRIGAKSTFARSLFVVGSGLALHAFPSQNPVLVGAGLVGAGTSLLLIAAMTAIQTETPGSHLGRVFAGYELVSTLPQTVAVGAGSLGLLYLDYRVLLVSLAVTSVLAGLITMRAIHSKHDWRDEEANAY